MSKEFVELKNFFPSGFMADYFDYVEPLTDAPVQFHIPAALCTLSTVIGRNVYLQLGDKRLYPNIWALLLGKSTLPRKTTSLQPGLRLLYELNPKLVFPDDFSIEALLEHLSEQPQGLLSFSEFSVLLDMCQRSYMAGLRGLLTNLYDCPPRFTRKLKSGEYTIENGFLSLIGASTVDIFKPLSPEMEKIIETEVVTKYESLMKKHSPRGTEHISGIIPRVMKKIERKAAMHHG